MAWDGKIACPRQNSNVAADGVPNQSMSTSDNISPKSTHVSDPALHPFLDTSFDPAEYLNATLPSLQTANASQKNSKDVPLAELSAETQNLLSQLSAHTTRLTNTLTQLTDEILRSGSRLAYEVEVLRGRTLGLSETLVEGLRDEVDIFVAGGLEPELAKKAAQASESDGTIRKRSSSLLTPKTSSAATKSSADDVVARKVVEPPCIAKLRTLSLVREGLDSVVKIFGDAMEWTFPPSEVSVSSSFLSVSAPEPGTDMQTTEEKGQQVSKKLRDEVMGLLMGEDPLDGIEAAAKKVEDLKRLAIVWKGTAEEKARFRLVESLAKMVEERHRELLRDAEVGSQGQSKQQEVASERSTGESRSLGGYGFISQLQKLRGGV